MRKTHPRDVGRTDLEIGQNVRERKEGRRDDRRLQRVKQIPKAGDRITETTYSPSTALSPRNVYTQGRKKRNGGNIKRRPNRKPNG